jgi:hypothetical protein
MDRRPLAVVFALAVALAVVPAPASAHANHAAVDSQVTADGTILIEGAFLAIDKPGFVVAHAVDDDGEPGEPLAVRSVPRRSGFRTALSLQLDPADLGEDGTRELWVVLHQDANSDGEFDPGTDNALSFFGQLAGERATIATGAAPAYVAAERFSPQSIGDGSVEVVAAALPDDGYLVVRSEAGGEPGPVVGHVALAAGEHTDVTVPLDPPAGSDGTARLHAELYTDDGDGRFDPESDSQVRAGGEPVGTVFTVNTTASTTATPSGGATTETAIVNTPTPTPATATTTAPAEGASTTGGQPGLTPLVAVLAVVAAGLLAARAARDR